MAFRSSWWLLLLLALCVINLQGVWAVRITEFRVPHYLENGSKTSVILDCVYEFSNDQEKEHVTIKWFYNSFPSPVYQWIPGRSPQSLELLKDRVNLEYQASEDRYMKHRALEILNPTTELTGVYKCEVSSLDAEDSSAESMVIYSQATNMNISYSKPTDDQVLVGCAAEGLFPQPSLQLFKGTSESDDTPVVMVVEEEVESDITWKDSNDGSYDIKIEKLFNDRDLDAENIFECSLSLPGVPMEEYSIKKNILYYPENLDIEDPLLPTEVLDIDDGELSTDPAFITTTPSPSPMLNTSGSPYVGTDSGASLRHSSFVLLISLFLWFARRCIGLS